jgi:3-hydroxyacyl-[acyl-carrier-protein] dehydratase
MNPHFRAFSFVDRIVHLDPGVGASGRYTVPERLHAFPVSLAVEAVGQLAAWVAMAAMDFKFRPIAGIAGRIDLCSPVEPGMVLDLSVVLETTENDAVAYGGEVRVDGRPVVQLEHCVGPMVRVPEFDDPAAVQARFQLLCAGGAPPGAFEGVPAIPLTRGSGECGKSLCATLAVPAVAALFGDHFPRRPVFPGTLQMQSNLELVSWLAAELAPPVHGSVWRARAISDVKLRMFVAPGDTLELEARLVGLTADAAVVVVETRRQQRLAGSARILLQPEGIP